MCLLQILDKTHGRTVVAIVVTHARSVREEAEVGREESIVLSGRPIVAVVLHVAHKGTAAITRSGEEDSTCGFEF